jgi:hypothetical protein
MQSIHVLRLEQFSDLFLRITFRLKFTQETVQGSNVVDLVKDVLNKRKYFNPQGWENSEKPYEKQMFHKI